MNLKSVVLTSCLLALAGGAHAVERFSLNNGNLVLEDIPPVPEQIKQDLKRYQSTRSGAFLDWTRDGKQIYISTRFGDVAQIHRVSFPGAARYQLTFFDEPVGGVQRQPDGDLLSFTMDAGGSEYAQLFVLDPASGDWKMLSDGKSRNGAVRWSRDGKSMAYQSTRRNGRS
ncbi:TolB family protein, partial [Thiolapillus sp.]